MTLKSYTPRAAQLFSALLFVAACGMTACAPEEDDNTLTPPFDAGFVMTTTDASPVVTAPGDAGTGTTTLPMGTPNGMLPLDAGMGTLPPVDSGGVVAADTGVVTTGDGGATPDGGSVAMRPDQGMGDGKDVVTIGDSWMSFGASMGIQNSVEKASGRDYRNFGVSGTKLLDEVIPRQYTTAKSEGPVKTVIMTGGGNDILQDLGLGILGGCADQNFDTDPACKKRIDEVAARLVTLWAEMAKDSVQDVIIIGYTKKASLVGNALTKSMLYSNEKIPPLCAAVPAPLRCHALDTDMEVPDLALQSDNIHPNAESYDKIGQAVWKLMQAKGVRR